ncbi:MAG: HisA/HisF-related TIM barrel protein, partial [Clostridia bacterium]
RRFGVQSVVASIDVKQDLLHRYRCAVCGGTRIVNESPQALAKRAQELGAGEILLNAIDRDGTRQGYDLKLIETVAGVLDVPLIACGGAKDARDMEQALHQAHAAAAGSMFVYFGPLKAVLINVPEEQELYDLGIYQRS